MRNFAICGRTLGLLASMMTMSGVAQAQGLTAGTLYDLCRDQKSQEWQAVGQWLCPGYVRGVIDGARLQALNQHGPGEAAKRAVPFCEPADTAPGPTITTVIGYIETRPESRNLPAAPVVFEALRSAWKCPP